MAHKHYSPVQVKYAHGQLVMLHYEDMLL